jgi:hypothetical protein
MTTPILINKNNIFDMNTTKINTLLLSAIFITGCASLSDLRNNKPDLDLTSLKPAKEIGVCIADKLETVNSTLDTMSARQTSNGYSISITQNMPGMISSQKDTIFVVDVIDTPYGSHTLFFNHFIAGGQMYYDIIKSCQEGQPVKINSTIANTGSEVSVTQKIRELEGLRKDGLITENDFQSKKKQLLDKF